MTELFRPTRYGNLEEVKRLVSEGADVNVVSNVSFFLARNFFMNFIRKMKILIDRYFLIIFTA